MSSDAHGRGKGSLLVTPDGRYFAVRGRLWRMTDPALPEGAREHLVKQLMDARRGVRDAKRRDDKTAEAQAHDAVDAAKRALGERGPVWWKDGSPDLDRRLVRNTPYASWYTSLPDTGARAAGPEAADIDAHGPGAPS